MEDTKKITKRDMYDAIKEAMNTGKCPIEPDEVIAFCDKEIAALDRKAEKARENAAKRRAEGDALTDKVRAVLTNEYETIADITDKIGEDDVTVSKVQYRLNQLVANGEAEKTDITVGEGQSKRTLKGYRVSTEVVVTED